jgi:hypothetical protein
MLRLFAPTIFLAQIGEIGRYMLKLLLLITEARNASPDAVSVTIFSGDNIYLLFMRQPPNGMAHLPQILARQLTLKTTFLAIGRRVPAPKAVRWSRC